MKILIALLGGFIFGLGLLVSGMNDPAKVRGFLDVFGEWRPELIAVMGSAVTVFFIAYQLSRKWKAPLFSERFHLPNLKVVDKNLIVGAILFGVGWGLVGLCPGPALVNLLTFDSSILWFVGALLVGNRLAHVWSVQKKH
ncbi:MAG: YeeE/YedE family protein [Oleibacter sp.]|nr:YeeE/YedE family protein [Thalassolituus sp.]